MSIICFEGPSAVGKTTTATAFGAGDGVSTVPEVNTLFDRPKDEPTNWYLERQVERWVVAREKNKSNDTVVLDGDPFQPLWYSWAYDYTEGQDLDFLEQFYRPKVFDGTIVFPDLYIIFDTSEDELRNRRKSDTLRQRRNFEKHLELIEPQQRYFRAVSSFSPGRVRFLEAESVHKNLKFVKKSTLGTNTYTAKESSVLFENIIEWLRDHVA